MKKAKPFSGEELAMKRRVESMSLEHWAREIRHILPLGAEVLSVAFGSLLSANGEGPAGHVPVELRVELRNGCGCGPHWCKVWMDAIDPDRCDHLLPNHNYLLTPDGESPECLLGRGHEGLHLAQLHDGSYLLWGPDPECRCLEDDCECFTYDLPGPDAAQAEALIASKK